MDPHVLVVEDESIVSMDIQRTLQRLGCRTSVAMSGEEALSCASRQCPDVALMDIMLPGDLDGIGTAARLRKELDVPIIYLTANADEETVQRAMATEPMGFLIKPFRERELISTIRIVMLRSEAEKRLRDSRQLYQSVFEAAGIGVVAVGPDGKVNWLNSVAEAAVGRADGECAATPLEELFRSLDEQASARVKEAVAAVCAGGAGVTFDDQPVTLVVPGQAEYTLQCAAPVPGEHGGGKGAVILMQPVGARTGPSADSGPPGQNGATAASSQNDVASPDSGEAPQDPSTGLPLRADAEHAIGESFPATPNVYAVPFRLSRFSFIQERFGHHAAEELMVFYSIHLAQSLTPSDRLFRWGPSSFLALIQRPGSEQQVVRETTRLCMVKLEKVLRIHSRTAMVVVSSTSQVFHLEDCESAAETIVRLDRFLASP